MNVYKTVLGMDKLSSQKLFSVVIIDDGNIIFKNEAMSINEIIELTKSFGIEVIAIDNIFEIGIESEIKKFANHLYRTNLIQVTGSPGTGFTSLSVIGKQIGFSGGEKLSPLRSAEACARAAMAGIGFIVKVYEPETNITISKRRKFGTGGMSEGRYRRSIEGAVLNLTGKIKGALVSRKIDYDLSIKKGSHGIEGASFT
ncbi:MAG: hypothetical protein LUP94_01475, partial [Candidatus Methanomethylicus sp.]|nr:hypothetical protein [Candidatus Methanomethylicus sp.]